MRKIFKKLVDWVNDGNRLEIDRNIVGTVRKHHI